MGGGIGGRGVGGDWAEVRETCRDELSQLEIIYSEFKSDMLQHE